MSEAEHQKAVVGYCDLKGIPCFHIPNGGYRNKREAAHLKSQGVKPGVPDLCIPVAKGGYHGLWVEMKDVKGRPTKSQLGWIKRLRGNGYAAYVCRGSANAIALIDLYMSETLDPPQEDATRPAS